MKMSRAIALVAAVGACGGVGFYVWKGLFSTQRGSLSLHGMENVPKRDRIVSWELRSRSIIGLMRPVLVAVTAITHADRPDHHYILMRTAAGWFLVTQSHGDGNISLKAFRTLDEAIAAGGGAGMVHSVLARGKCRAPLRVDDVVRWARAQRPEFCLVANNCQDFCRGFVRWCEDAEFCRRLLYKGGAERDVAGTKRDVAVAK